jgi:hypothetical protein
MSESDHALIDELARDRIPYVPFFPLAGFTPVQSPTLSAVARRLGAAPMQVALAWLLRAARPTSYGSPAPRLLRICGITSPRLSFKCRMLPSRRSMELRRTCPVNEERPLRDL